MVDIYETEDFTVVAAEKPHITRTDGGHILIIPKKKVVNRQHLTPAQAIELMKLSMVVGEAMETGLNNRGIDVGRINYQDCGNWGVFKPEGPWLHMHLYGRAKSAKIQKYGQATHFPHPNDEPDFYKENEPLNTGDILEIRSQIETILKTDKYKNFN